MIAIVTTSQNWRKRKKKKRATDWELSYRNNFFNHSTSEKIPPQNLDLREKQPQQDGPDTELEHENETGGGWGRRPG
jgi:hypothetical protein